ncbi:hypothetical protein M9Y10_031764 [Tritrichomonas musculus]|uniref:Uncharacterized protein n=1 Tax=Tritrichomonas musculus TaxID=1915356 RepID=A0ABR2GP72_9EUKA
MISFKILKNPSTDSFKEELSRATTMLTINEAQTFFDILLGHFNRPINYETGCLILSSIRQVIRSDDLRNIFIENQFIDRLPFSNGQYADSLYDIMYDIIIINPDVLDSNLCPLFGQLFAHQPEKALVIIGYVVKNLKKFENPWPILDLLFYERKNFNNQTTGSNYITLLAYLISNHKDFAKARAKTYYDVIISMLPRNYCSVLKTGYDALRIIHKYYPEGEIPVSSIAKQVFQDELRNHILSFLISLPIDHKDFQNPVLIQALVKSSQISTKPTATLLRISKSKENAEVILKNVDWTTMNLPNLHSTLQLFLAIFSHQELRSEILKEKRTFAEFLCRLVDNGKSGVLIIIAMILRRINIDDELLSLLEETGFLHSFIVTTKRLNDEISMHSCILLISTLSKVGFEPSFLEIAHTIARLAVKNVYLSALACHAAADLNIYPKCKEVFNQYRLAAFFRSKLDDQKLRKIARKFLQLDET